jgi:hypothetical protein
MPSDDLMRRLLDYLFFLFQLSGFGYIALWGLTLWTLGDGAAVFGRSGVCHPDEAKLLFYWVCEPDSSLSLLAMASNTALTATAWGPVYVAAATVKPDAIAIAAPILVAHVVGLPAAIFLAMRSMLVLIETRRIFFRKADVAEQPLPLFKAAEKIQPLPRVKARSTFGLRGVAS